MAATVDQKLLRATKFPPEFNQKVDMNKVNLEVIKGWITNRISEILGTEDDVVIELCFNLIEASRYPKIKEIQIQLTGFLEKDTAAFCQQLWKLCMSAQNSPQGVPQELLEAKKAELIQEKIEAEKAAEEARLRREQFDRRDRDIDSIRDRERFERGGDRGGRGGYGRGGGDSWRGGRDDRDFGGRGGRGRGGFERGRGGRDFDRGPRRSRSPGFYEPPRARDTYVPRGRDGGRHENRRRSPSPSKRSLSRSVSRSRSPPRRRRSPTRSITPPSRRRPARSISRSPSPAGGSRRAPVRSRRRNRSYSSSSRSRSPPSRKRRRSLSSSRSRSPPPKSRRRRSVSSSRSRSYSRSPVRSPSPRAGSSRAVPRSPRGDLIKSRSTNARKGRDVNMEAGRLSRGNSRSPSRSRSPPSRRRRNYSSSRSRSRSPQRKRQGSIPRYAPKARRDSFVRSPSREAARKDTRDRRRSPSREDMLPQGGKDDFGSRSRSASPPRRHSDSRSPSPDNMRDVRDISMSRSRSRSRSPRKRSRSRTRSPARQKGEDVDMVDSAPEPKVNTTAGAKKNLGKEALELKAKLVKDKFKRLRASVSSGQSGQKIDAAQNISPPAPDFTE